MSNAHTYIEHIEHGRIKVKHARLSCGGHERARARSLGAHNTVALQNSNPFFLHTGCVLCGNMNYVRLGCVVWVLSLSLGVLAWPRDVCHVRQ